MTKERRNVCESGQAETEQIDNWSKTSKNLKRNKHDKVRRWRGKARIRF
jgi:hypothetical protein